MKSLKSAARKKRTGPRTNNSDAARSTSNERRNFELVESAGISLHYSTTSGRFPGSRMFHMTSLRLRKNAGISRSSTWYPDDPDRVASSEITSRSEEHT